MKRTKTPEVLARAAQQLHTAEAVKINRKMHDGENGNDNNSLQDMSEADMLAEFMDLMSRDGIINKKLRKILDYVERVLSGAD